MKHAVEDLSKQHNQRGIFVSAKMTIPVTPKHKRFGSRGIK